MNPPTVPLPDPKPPFERLALTAAEVCETLQISDVTLWRIQQKGLLSPIDGIRHRRFFVEAVRRFASGG